MMFDPRWEQIHKERQWGVYPCEHLVRFVKSRQWPEESAALDIGCGAGAQSYFLAREKFDVIAVDGSPSAINRLRRNSRITPLCYDIASVPGFNEEFDLIVDVCTLQHVDLSAAFDVIRRARKWLKPEGWLFSLMATPEHMQSPIEPRVISKDGLTRMFNGFDIELGMTGTLMGDYCTEYWIVQAQRT